MPKNRFLDTECEHSGAEESDDEEYEMNTSDEDFIDDDDVDDEQDWRKIRISRREKKLDDDDLLLLEDNGAIPSRKRPRRLIAVSSDDECGEGPTAQETADTQPPTAGARQPTADTCTTAGAQPPTADTQPTTADTCTTAGTLRANTRKATTQPPRPAARPAHSRSAPPQQPATRPAPRPAHSRPAPPQQPATRPTLVLPTRVEAPAPAAKGKRSPFFHAPRSPITVQEQQKPEPRHSAKTWDFLRHK